MIKDKGNTQSKNKGSNMVGPESYESNVEYFIEGRSQHKSEDYIGSGYATYTDY